MMTVRLDKMSRHVLIYGMVFASKEKAPFMQSGFSVLGALEYDKNTDMVKCHECGEFKTYLAHHLIYDHGDTAVGYRHDHGLSSSTALCGLKYSTAQKRKYQKSGISRRKTWKRAIASVTKAQRLKNASSPRVSAEMLNLRRSCKAQLVARVIELATKLKKTPTYGELRAAGICPSSLVLAFGSLTETMKLANLEPNFQARWHGNGTQQRAAA